MKKTLALTLVIMLLLSLLMACREPERDLFADAMYTEDTTLGAGDTTFTLNVTVEDKTVVFTINTGETNLAKAFLESGIVEGDDGIYGLYIKKVNGITADYDVDASWWGLYVGDEASMVGADGITIENGAQYSLVYSK